MPKVLDYFDGGFYLNLDSRPDRRLTFEARSNEQSLTLERFSAIEKVGPIPNPNNDPNWHFKVSCTDSHFSMIRLAKERGWKTCLIFEDDCIFASDFSNKVRNCLPEIDKTDWDILYFGGEPNGLCNPISNSLALCTGGVYGTHAYAIHERFYDRVLNNMSFNLVIDSFYINFPNRRYLIFRDLLAWQDSEFFSELLGQYPPNKYELYSSAYKKFVK